MSELPVLIDSVNVYAEYAEGDYVGTYEDDWGVFDVYEIASFYVLNRSNDPHLFACDDVNGVRREVVLEGGEDVSKNLPKPQRINSYPLSVRYSRL